MGDQLTTKQLAGMHVVDSRRGKRIGKVRHFVFHPSARRVIGFTVKRPDAALMFHRKDLFVSLGGFDVAGKQVVVRDDASATDKGAIRALGVDWDKCVIWVGMPVMTAAGEMLGYVDVVTFDAQTGSVISMTTENGAANDVVLGKRSIPGDLVRGFKRGQGVALVPMGDYQGEDQSEFSETGAILVADEAAELPADGGVAAAAGKATAVVGDKARKGARKARVVVANRAEKAKPMVDEVARRTGEAVEAGAYAAGKQLGRASGMFAAFKEEFDKASRGEGD